MVIRRGGDFDLPALRRQSVFRQDSSQQLKLLLAQRFFVLFRVARPFPRKLGHDGVLGDVLLIHPCQL